MNTAVFLKGEPYGHALVWKWDRRNTAWICETHDGHTLKVRGRRQVRGPFKWIAEAWLPGIVEATGRLHQNADMAQNECIYFLKKWRKANT